MEKQVSKRRMELEKRVVKVKIGANYDQKLKSQFPPSDSWSWRKYGQKPIKGTPYPRGYYKCTTSKGCLAKKQVERSKDDASMVIITYTSCHNHPGPSNQAHQQHRPIKSQPTSPVQAQPQPPPPPILPVTKAGDQVQEQEEDKPYVVTLENKCFQDEKSVSWSGVMMSLSSAGPNSGGGNEFFDELGELPHTSASSSFTSYMKNYFFDELRMLVPHP